MRDFWRAIKFASINKKLTFFAVLTSFVLTGIDLIQPLILKSIFDLIGNTISKGEIGTVTSAFWFYIISYGILLFSQDIVGQISNYAVVIWWNKTKIALSEKVFKHLETLSLKYFETNTTGKIKERVDKGINDLNNIMESAIIDIAPQVFYILVATYVLSTVNKLFGLVLLVSIPLFVLVSSRFTGKLIKQQDTVRDIYEKVSGITTESIINIKTIKSYATEHRHFLKFSNTLNEAIQNDIKYWIIRITMNTFRFIVVNSAQILILGLGIYWTLTGKITLGVFMLAWQYTNRSIQPLWYLTRQIDNIQRDMRSVRRVFELLDTDAEITDVPNAKKIKIKGGEIQFEKIDFSYNEHRVIKDLSLTVPAGKVLAIVGKSGSGKTTIIKLLSRFYETQKGSILIDGQDITQVTQQSLRENIGVVLQDSILFNDSAANNIAYGKSKAKRSEIVEASKMANADVFISKLSEGYDTFVGERGVRLSGGEQQRINIARAILKNPPILILDEATSSLDSESEQMIQEALWKLIKGRTTIIIAHRLSTVMRADLIVVMDKGKISEMGTHDDLVAQKGIYSKLYDIQSGGYLGENIQHANS